MNAYCFTDDDFQDLQDNFMEKYYNEFEDTEENKLIYMDIFKDYVSMKVCLYALHFYRVVVKLSLEEQKTCPRLRVLDE